MHRLSAGLLTLTLWGAVSLPTACLLAQTAASQGPQRPRIKVAGCEGWARLSQRADGHWESPQGTNDWGVTALMTLALLAEGDVTIADREQTKGGDAKAVLAARDWLARQVLAASKYPRGITVDSWNQILTCYALVECDGQLKKESEATEVLFKHLIDSKSLRRRLFEDAADSPTADASDVLLVRDSNVLRIWLLLLLEARKDLGFKNPAWLSKAMNACGESKTRNASPYEQLFQLLYTIHKRGNISRQGHRYAERLIQLSSRLYSDATVDYEFCYLATVAFYQIGHGSWKAWRETLYKGLTSLQIQDGELKGAFETKGRLAQERGSAYASALAGWALSIYYRYGTDLIRRKVLPPWTIRNQKEDGRWNSPGKKHDWGVTALNLLALLSEGSGFDEMGKANGAYGESVLRAKAWLSKQVMMSAASPQRFVEDDWDKILTCYALVECDAMAKKESQAGKLLGEHLLQDESLRSTLFGPLAEDPVERERRAILRSWFLVMLTAREDHHLATPRSLREAMVGWIVRSKAQTSPQEALSRLLYRIRFHEVPGDQMKADADLLSGLPQKVNSGEKLNDEFFYLTTLALYQVGQANWERWKKPLEKGVQSRRIQQGAEEGSYKPLGKRTAERGPACATALALWTLDFYYAWGLRLLR